MTKWILIIMITKYNFGALDHIEFNTKESCEVAAAEFLRKDNNASSPVAFCVEKP